MSSPSWLPFYVASVASSMITNYAKLEISKSKKEKQEEKIQQKKEKYRQTGENIEKLEMEIKRYNVTGKHISYIISTGLLIIIIFKLIVKIKIE